VTETRTDKELEELSFEYDPDTAPQPPWRWVVSTAAASVLLVVLGLAWGTGISKCSHRPSDPVAEPTSSPSIRIADAAGEMALLLLEEAGTVEEMKVISTTASTAVIQDLPQGKFRPLAAALSPEQDSVAYLREDNGHRVAGVVDLQRGSDALLDQDKLEAAAGGTTLQPCSWSSVAWSPDGLSFSFFGCTRDRSLLVVVVAETELSPIVIKKTEAAEETPRQAFWLNDTSLLYTYSDATTGEIGVNRVQACPDCVPHSMYKR
jgi:hypothetical protein